MKTTLAASPVAIASAIALSAMLFNAEAKATAKTHAGKARAAKAHAGVKAPSAPPVVDPLPLPAPPTSNVRPGFASTASASSSSLAGTNAMVIYSGQTLAAAQMQAASWGGGQAADHQGDAYTTAGHTILVDTAGLYQGGQIIFNTPVALGDLKADRTRFLQIIFSAQPSQRYAANYGNTGTPMVNPYGVTGMPGTGGPYSAGGPYGGRSPYGPGGPRGRGPYGPAGPGGRPSFHYSLPAGAFQIAQNPYANPDGMGPDGTPIDNNGNPYSGYPGPGGYPGPDGNPMPMPALPPDETLALPKVPIRQLHVILEFANGARAEMLRPITVSLGDDVNWLRAGIPLTAIPLPQGSAGNANLKKIYIGSDSPASLTIGEIRLINDTTAITADAGKEQTVPVGTYVTVVGAGEGGASSLKYEWNFDSPSNFVSETEGVKASTRFTTPGDHVVTLRVSDVDGIKAPATSTVTIHVVAQ